MKKKIRRLLRTIKDECLGLIALFSLCLAISPFPSSLDKTCQISIRTIIAAILVVFFCLYVLVRLFILSRQDKSFFDEDVNLVDKDEMKEEISYTVYIDFNPAYYSMMLATVYSVKKPKGQEPIFHPICNGQVAVRSTSEQVEVYCRLPKGHKACATLDGVSRGESSQTLVVRPIYEEVKYE